MVVTSDKYAAGGLQQRHQTRHRALPREVDISPTSDAGGGESREHLIGTLPARDFPEDKKRNTGSMKDA